MKINASEIRVGMLLEYKNVQNKESPDWLKNRIISLGLKPISAIVDITNYIMFDLNRPLQSGG